MNKLMYNTTFNSWYDLVFNTRGIILRTMFEIIIYNSLLNKPIS